MLEMTRLTLQKNVLIHRTVSVAATYDNIGDLLKDESRIEVKCISCNAKRRFKKIENLGFSVESIICEISKEDDMEFAKYIFKRI